MRVTGSLAAVAVVVASVAVGGYLLLDDEGSAEESPRDEDERPTDAADGPRVPISLQGCAYVEIVATVPLDAVRSRVPEPFEARARPDGTVGVLLGGANCQEATALNATRPASFAWTSVVIQPPTDAHLAGATAEFFLYRLEHMGLDDLYAQVADASGAERLPLTRIEAKVEATGPTLLLQGPQFEHRIATPPTPVPPGGASESVVWREFGRVEGGFALLEARLVPDPGAGTVAGVVRPQAGSAAGDVLGSAASGSVSFGTDYGVLDGYMQFLAHPTSA